MQPMNYTIQTPNSTGLLNEALQIKGMVERNRLLEAQQLAEQQKMQEAQRQAELNEIKRQRFAEVAKNPTAKAVQSFMVEFPELSEQFKKSYDTLSDNEKRMATEVQFATKSAIESGKPDLAISDLDRRIEAAKNMGDTSAEEKLGVIRNLVIANPSAALLTANAFLAATMDPDKFATMEKTRGEESRAQQEAPYKLEQERVKAKFAEPEALLDLEQKGWNIKAIQEDIGYKKQMARIAAMNASTSRTDSDLKRQELQLKVQEAQSKLNSDIRAKVSEAESARASIDNFINTADRLMKNPMLPRVLGPIEGRISSAPLSDEAADAVALIDTLSSQAFLSQIPAMKGSGALSDAEGKKLQAALTNLSRVQSEKQFEANLKEAQRILLKSRSNLAQKYGIPDTVPDTPAAAPSGRSIEDLLKKYGQ